MSFESYNDEDKQLITLCDSHMARFKKLGSDKNNAPGNEEYNRLYQVKQSILVCSGFAMRDGSLVVPEWKNDIAKAFNVLIKMKWENIYPQSKHE